MAEWSQIYEKYLASEAWRRRRNRALRLAGYRCQQCEARTGLEVHHRTYDRLGAERDSDLEVRCQACHRGWHRDVVAARLATVMVRRAIAQTPADAPAADLVEAAKQLCVQAGRPYDGDRIWRALDLLQRPTRRGRRIDPIPGPPPLREEASIAEVRALLAKLWALETPPIKAMPDVGRPLSDTEYNARLQLLRDQAQQIGAGPQRRRPIAERLAEIWGEEKSKD